MKKKIIWRLKEQPTVESLQKLVENKILTKEEAREILFSSENINEKDDRDIESLKSEVKFLRELVQKLAERSKIVSVMQEVTIPYRNDVWCQPYNTWCGTINDSGYYTTNSNTMISSTSSDNFNSIATF